MKNEFKKILGLLEKINQINSNNMVSFEELNKEYRRINDLTWLDNEALKHLSLLRKINPSSIDEVMEQVCYFKVNLSTYVWHIENIQDITERFIRKNKND